MIKKTVLFSICLFVVACSYNKEDKLPDNVLTVQKMAKVMVDVNLLESSLNMNVIHINTANKNKASILFQTLKKHNITPKQYQESFDYYTQHLDSLDRIYELVLIDLSEMQAEVRAQKISAKDTMRQQLLY